MHPTAIPPPRILRSLIAALLIPWWPDPARAQPTRHEFTRLLMGVEVRILTYGDDPEAASAAAALAFARIAAIEDVASDWRPSSEVMRLCAHPAGTSVPVSDDLYSLLDLSQRVAHATNGAFDVTIGPVTHLWRHARPAGRPPDPQLIAVARSRVGFRHLMLDPVARTATLGLDHMIIDLGGIAQGCAAAEALKVMADEGFPATCVDLSGDIALGAPPPGAPGWRVAIPDVDDWRTLTLSATSVSTSGDGEQSVMIDGQRRSHIIEPASALGVVGAASVTVIHHDAALADAMATALSVLPPDRGLELGERLPDLDALIIRRAAAGDLTARATPSFPPGTRREPLAPIPPQQPDAKIVR